MSDTLERVSLFADAFDDYWSRAPTQFSQEELQSANKTLDWNHLSMNLVGSDFRGFSAR